MWNYFKKVWIVYNGTVIEKVKDEGNYVPDGIDDRVLKVVTVDNGAVLINPVREDDGKVEVLVFVNGVIVTAINLVKKVLDSGVDVVAKSLAY